VRGGREVKKVVLQKKKRGRGLPNLIETSQSHAPNIIRPFRANRTDENADGGQEGDAGRGGQSLGCALCGVGMGWKSLQKREERKIGGKLS